MKGFVLKKSLIGKQDLLLGRQSETQERGNSLVNVDGIEMIYPVRTLEALKHLDPTEYETAFLFGENTLDILDPEFGGLDAHINELYYFDFNSNEDELLPYVIKSDIREYGRWKLSKLGEKRLYRIAVPLLTELVDEKKEEIIDALRETMDEQIAIVSAETMSAVEKRGLLYNHDLVYQGGNFTRVLVNTPKGIQEKSFLRKTNGGSTSPLPEVHHKVGDTNIYTDAPVTEGWETIVDYKPNTIASIKLDNAGYVRLFKDTDNPKGQIDLVFRGLGDAVVGCATIEFFGMGTKYFKIREAIYSDIIKNKGLTDGDYTQEERLIYLPSFVIASDETSFGVHFGSLAYAQGLEVDFAKCSAEAKPIVSQVVPAKKFAIRPNGGSEIPNIGELAYFNFVAADETNLVMYQYFTTGKLRWTSAMELDPDIYHQYFTDGNNLASLNQSIGGRYLRNAGQRGVEAGQSYDEALPNISGKTGWVQRNDGWATSIIQNGVAVTARNNNLKATGDFEGIFNAELKNNWTTPSNKHDLSNDYVYPPASLLRLTADASKANPIYQDGAGVRPRTYGSVLTIQVF